MGTFCGVEGLDKVVSPGGDEMLVAVTLLMEVVRECEVQRFVCQGRCGARLLVSQGRLVSL
jgi:hypothetical protein